MCLCSKTGKKIAKHDIVCYKALFKLAGDYYTPVRWKKVANAVLTGSRLFRGGLFRQKHTNDGVTVIEGGYIHVYKNLKRCRFLYEKCACFKCVIPKGTEYWVGSGSELAARKIRFVKQVK